MEYFVPFNDLTTAMLFYSLRGVCGEGGGWGWRILAINFVRNFKSRVNILNEVNYYQISQILLKMTMENIILIRYLQRSFFSIVHFTNLCSVII